MHASRAKLSASFVCLAILTSSGIASAGPARRRDGKSVEIVPLVHGSLMLKYR